MPPIALSGCLCVFACLASVACTPHPSSARVVADVDPARSHRPASLEHTALAPACEAGAPDPEASLVLRRTACMGPCPVFEVVVYPDGTVRYTGKHDVCVRGSRTWTIDPSTSAALFVEAACAHPESWERSYSWPQTDGARADVIVDLGGSSPVVRVRDYPPCEWKRAEKASPAKHMVPPSEWLDTPESLCRLEHDIVLVTGVRTYVECDDAGSDSL